MANVSSGWTCPDCWAGYEFHGGPPSSGGPLSAFTNESADLMWTRKERGEDCCFQNWWRPIFRGVVDEF